MDSFELRGRDGLARLGRLHTTHGSVRTPLLMPVVHPGKSAITASELRKDFGFEMVIANSFIIRSKDAFRSKAMDEGIHSLLGFDGPIMTDSGTFQMYFHDLPDSAIDPLEIVRFQRDIGSDVGTILDVFSDPHVGRRKVEEDTRVSLDRARSAVPEKGNMMLAGTVQGGVYVDLREASARELAGLNFDVHPIGGVVPLMESYRFSDVVRVTLAAKKHLPPNRPVHLFGCGHPMFLSMAAAMGCDLFDSASYVKFAEDDRLLLANGTAQLSELREMPCDCEVCSNTNPGELRSLDKREREVALMRHNLYVTAGEMRRVRQAIEEDKLLELVAIRARSHPTLMDALNVLLGHSDQIEAEDPVGKTASICYTGSETSKHPSVLRFNARVLERYPYRGTQTLVLVPHLGDRPYSETAPSIGEIIDHRGPDELIVLYVTPFGVVPWEYEQVYPAQQCIFPDLVDKDTLQAASERLRRFIESIEYERVVWFNRKTPTNSLRYDIEWKRNLETAESATGLGELLPEPLGSGTHGICRRLEALFQYEWKVDISKALHVDQIETVISRKTGKIRYLKHDGQILFTLVPTTGLLTPTIEGGQLLLRAGIGSEFRVVMNDDAVPFVKDGKSALAKFVLEASETLRPGEEVLLLDKSGELLGVGPASLTGREMKSFKRGAAVVTRHSLPQQPA